MRMREDIEQQTIEKSELKRIFSIKMDRTINSYIEKDVFRVVGNAPKFDPFDQTLFDYEHICKILGLKKLPNEPFLTTDEAIKILGLPIGYDKGSIRKYCARHRIPYYILENARGTKTYFLRSELESALEYKIKWGTEFPDYVVKNNILRDVFKMLLNPVICKTLNVNERNIITEIVLNAKTLGESALIHGMSTEQARRFFVRGIRDVLENLQSLDFNLNKLEELSKENSKLKFENSIFKNKLKILTKEQDKTEYKHLDSLSKPFSDFNLPARVMGLLNRMESRNLYDLSKFRRSEVEKYQNAGTKTIDALEILLRQNNLDWEKEETPDVILKKLKQKKVYKRTELKDVKTRLEEIEKKLKIKK